MPTTTCSAGSWPRTWSTRATGEIIGECWERISTELPAPRGRVQDRQGQAPARKHEENDTIFQTIEKDKVRSYEEALIEFFKKMRPGNPVACWRGKRLIEEMFFSEKRYDLGLVGRYKINRTLQAGRRMTDLRLLTADDVVDGHEAPAQTAARTRSSADDIDHLGNRRVRVGRRAAAEPDPHRPGRMEKTARERMAIIDLENLLPHNLINAKPVVVGDQGFLRPQPAEPVHGPDQSAGRTDAQAPSVGAWDRAA